MRIPDGIATIHGHYDQATGAAWGILMRPRMRNICPNECGGGVIPSEAF